MALPAAYSLSLPDSGVVPPISWQSRSEGGVIAIALTGGLSLVEAGGEENTAAAAAARDVRLAGVNGRRRGDGEPPVVVIVN